MIVVSYVNEYVEGEPGPNFYWRGEPNDYLKLINDLHRLGKENQVTISATKLCYIHLDGFSGLEFKSSAFGKKLVALCNNKIIVDIDQTLWREVFHKFLSISFVKSHNFVEFDEIDIYEDANFIISSEK